MGGWYAFGWAAGAQFAISILDFAKLAATPKRSRRASFSDPAYLFKFFGHPLVSGFLGAAYVTYMSNAKAWTIVIIGAAAPSVWRNFANAGPAVARTLLRQLADQEPPDDEEGV